MLITGTVNTLTKKVQNDCVAEGIHGDKHAFSHAWYLKTTISIDFEPISSDFQG